MHIADCPHLIGIVEAIGNKKNIHVAEVHNEPTASSTSANPVSGASGSGGSPYQFTPTNMIGDVASYASAMKSMSDARKTNTESDLLDKYGVPTYESQIGKTMADTYFTQRLS